MSPSLQHILHSKTERRKRQMALSYPEKVRIVEQMRTAAREMKAAASHTDTLREEAAPYKAKRP